MEVENIPFLENNRFATHQGGLEVQGAKKIGKLRWGSTEEVAREPIWPGSSASLGCSEKLLNFQRGRNVGTVARLLIGKKRRGLVVSVYNLL